MKRKQCASQNIDISHFTSLLLTFQLSFSSRPVRFGKEIMLTSQEGTEEAKPVTPVPETDLSSTDQPDDSPPPGTTPHGIAELVRSYSRSLVRAASHADGVTNPFLDDDPELDPNLPSFDAIKWAKALLHHSKVDPDRYSRSVLGVSCRNLSIHGYGKDTDYQMNVLNVLLQGPLMIKEWISQRQRKIDIIRDFDGLFESGEMTLVLGRPGRYVKALRTIKTFGT